MCIFLLENALSRNQKHESYLLENDLQRKISSLEFLPKIQWGIFVLCLHFEIFSQKIFPRGIYALPNPDSSDGSPTIH